MLAHDPALLPAPTHTDEARLPSGVVTFLLTDIEDSTRRWEEHLEAMAQAIVLHDDTIASVVHAAGGTLLKSKDEGDSTLSVFARTTDAVAAALAVRDRLDQVPWPSGAALAVRFALHTGEALERAGDYFGPTLNRAARIRALAVGGQILVSQASAELIRDHLPAGSDLVELGAFELRDLERPERVYALVEPGVPGRDVARGVFPYQGLLAFEPTDHERFFGLDDQHALLGSPRRRRRRWPLIVGAIALVVALVAAGAALLTGGGPTATPVQGVVAPKGYTPRYEPEACPSDVLSDPSIHVPGLVCGSLLVPQDRSNPHGRMIRVGVLRAPARTQGNNLPPVIDVGAHDSLALSPARDRAELIQINDRGLAWPRSVDG